MIRIGNLTKIGFSRISTLPAAAGQILSSHKFSEKIPDKNSINSIIDEIKHGIYKLESEIGRSFVIDKGDMLKGHNAVQPHFTPIPRTIAEKAYKELEEITLHRETMKYAVDDEPKQWEMKIELKQNENGKYIKISQKFIEKGENAIHNDFPNIPLSKDANRLLGAMYALETEWPENYVKALRQNKPTKICQQTVEGPRFHYKLGIHLDANKQLDFQMETVPKRGNFRVLNLHGPIPIDVFYWMKEQIAEFVDEYDEYDDNDEDEDDEDDYDDEE